MNIDVHVYFSGTTVRVVSLHPVQNNVDVQSLLLVGQVSLCVYVQREREMEYIYIQKRSISVVVKDYKKECINETFHIGMA